MRPASAPVLLLVLAVLAAAALGAPPTTSTTTTTTPDPRDTAGPSRSARASAHVHTVAAAAAPESRPTLSRAAVMAAARAAVAARALEAARLAGAAGARLALAAAAPALRGRPSPGMTLVVGPVGNGSEPRCANVTSLHYSLDMLLGTWYVVEVISPVSVGTLCDGFQLTKLNVSRAWDDAEAEAVIMSRFARLPGGPTVYMNRTVLVGGGAGGQQDGVPAPMLYDQLAVTDYSPDGRHLSITACHEGQHWTYVYSRQPQPAAASDLQALHRRLAAAGVATPEAPDAAPSTAPHTTTTPPPLPETTTEDDSPPWWRSLSYTPAPPPAFNVSECGW